MGAGGVDCDSAANDWNSGSSDKRGIDGSDGACGVIFFFFLVRLELVILLCRIVLTVFLVVGLLIYPRCHGTRSLCCLVTTWPHLFANNIEQKTQYQQRGQVYLLVVLQPLPD